MTLLHWTSKVSRASRYLENGTLVRSFSTSVRRRVAPDSNVFKVAEEVRQAVAEKRPVVALESTIYTHGFPYPENLVLAARLESLVRDYGGVPATIGILDGVARVGLDAEELVRLVASSESSRPLKVSRRDLAFALGMKSDAGLACNGGTTVAGTSILAHLAGIKIFATGGLGGVHRGAEHTMDISADLIELGRTPITVISSGCKSFLDIPKTLEVLETQGVGVGTFADGRTGRIDFPAFYTRDSGIKSPTVIADEFDAAKLIYAQSALGLQSGLLFANPIPERFSIPLQQMEHAIDQAIREADANGATGAASTPYILSKIKDLTGSKSLEANTALVEANVIRGTKIAVALSALEPRSGQVVRDASSTSTIEYTSKASQNPPPQTAKVIPPFGSALSIGTASNIGSSTAPKPLSEESSAADVFVAGSLAIDLSCDFVPRAATTKHQPEIHTSNPSTISQSLGGVGHNVARAAHLMGAQVQLCSAVAEDLAGRTVLEALTSDALSTASVKVFSTEDGVRTAQYVAVNDARKDLVLAMADMSILEKRPEHTDIISSTLNDFWLPQLRRTRPRYLGLDGNWQPEYLTHWLQTAAETSTRVLFEPVSNVKSTGVFRLPDPHDLRVYPQPAIHVATPNTHELAAMYVAAQDSRAFEREDWFSVIDAFGIPHSGARTQLALATSNELVDQGVPQQSLQLLPFMPIICTKLGPQGVLLTQIIPAYDDRLSDGRYTPYILSRCANGSEDDVRVGGVYMRLFPSVEEVAPEDVISVNGVGDTFAGTLLAGLSKRGQDARVEDLIDLAQRAAVLTLKSNHAVSPGLGTLRVLL